MSTPGRFRVGDRVRVRTSASHPTINPRTPLYARGHEGVVVAAYGIIDNPLDHHLPYEPLYTLRFDGRELLGDHARHEVVAELHEEWLEPID